MLVHFKIIFGERTYAFKHDDDVFGVAERPNVFEITPIDDGHRLQAHALHFAFAGQQESVIEIVEKLIPKMPNGK